MIVDDEAAILNGIRHLIVKENTLFTDIVSIQDSVEAVRAMQTFKPDLLITDIQMPGMNGLELIREAQSLKIKRFVILTGHDVFEYARQAVRLGAVDYLLKPVDPKELSALLARLSLEMVEEESFTDRSDGHEEEVRDSNANIRKFKDFIQRNFMRDLSLEEVASHLQLHPNYVCILLKRETNMTFLQYLRTVRIERAKALLSGQPRLSLDAVAKSVGYDSPRHFYKTFKHLVGQTPGTFRSMVVEQESCNRREEVTE